MTSPGPAASRALRLRLRQPDQRSCGAAVLVMTEVLTNEAYAAWLANGGADRFEDEVLAMHRRATGPIDAAGRIQAPWTRLLGTPPWAVSRQLTARRGRPHQMHPVLPWSRTQALDEIRTAAALDAVPLFVGSVLPRHVVLVLDADLTTYDPASGRTRTVDAEEFAAGRIRDLAWPVPWFWVSPR
ncbi:MAG: hypothetical protein H0X12_16300 [Nocardioides sp.]|nr:hypothetical protein [Nocardioides sp.]